MTYTANRMTAPTTTETVNPTHLVARTSLVIALCILGDSLMYGILPLEATNLGISLPLVGVLLSANRLIRLFSNGWASAIFARFGARRPLIGAALLGLISTIFYGVGWGFLFFLGARMLWGIAWSALRQGGYQAVWHGGQATKGRLTGLLWGIVRMGSATAVLGGGFLYDRYGYTTTILVVALVTALALPVVWTIRWPLATQKPGEQPSPTSPAQSQKSSQWVVWRELIKEPLVRWLLGAGAIQLFLSGIVIPTTSIYLAERLQGDDSGLLLGIGIATITGMLQGVRWLSDITVGPTIGRVSDHIGQARMALLLSTTAVAAMLGLISFSGVPALLALLLYFLCDSGINVTLSAAASGVAMQGKHPHHLIGAYTTAGDLGSSMGPLLAFSIGRVLGLPLAYAATAILGLLVVARYVYLAQKTERAEHQPS